MFLDIKSSLFLPLTKSFDIYRHWEECLHDLQQKNSQKQVFHLNIFFDTGSWSENHRLRKKLEEEVQKTLKNKIAIAVIFQRPADYMIVTEVLQAENKNFCYSCHETSFGRSVYFETEKTGFLAGNIYVNQHSAPADKYDFAFEKLGELLVANGFHAGHIVRQWNYIGNILQTENTMGNYQMFNIARSKFYGLNFPQGYPAATGIGMNDEGIAISFYAVRSEGIKKHIFRNPNQTAPYEYSGFGGTLELPKFERALGLEISGLTHIFVSGTASIFKDETVETGNAVAQTKVTLQNISKLAETDKNGKDKFYSTIRVYVKNQSDLPAIREITHSFFGHLPVNYLIADICREDLLVEIECEISNY